MQDSKIVILKIWVTSCQETRTTKEFSQNLEVPQKFAELSGNLQGDQKVTNSGFDKQGVITRNKGRGHVLMF